MKRPIADSAVGSSATIDTAGRADFLTETTSSANYEERKNSFSSSSTTTTTTDSHSGTSSSNKRPRTERYLHEDRRLEKQQETVDFFQQRLQVIQRRRKTVAGSSTSFSPPLQGLQRNLDRCWQSQTQQFHQFRQQMIKSAQKRIHMKEGIECLQQCVMQQQQLHGRDDCPVKKLQQGLETTTAVLDLIASFAGNPSDGELSDCLNLLAVAATREQS
ncbi:hypothetical protein IV203_016150 [Nitzschia inconspicua]|uniref:Uncharacterized protein n=1 Tax=Nitzschia inconspicua TaxID=303405 RepID=A0A9K3KQQ0_9STRA|nr:hypothetical protein IV203_016150 [Nitzschia inconspicua]